MKNDFSHLIQSAFHENILVHQRAADTMTKKIQDTIDLVVKSIENGGTLFWAGNGGSAADSQHMAAELIGRFKKERKAIKSMALTTNTSILTAIGNDYSYDIVFCRPLEAFGKPGDILMAISTSGNSKNIIEASKVAKNLGMHVIGLTGESGGKLAELADILLNVPSKETARVQEVHLLIEHTSCEAVEIAHT